MERGGEIAARWEEETEEGGVGMDKGAESYRRFLAGDADGLTELVAAYYDGLVLFLLPVAGSQETAEDLAEDTFLRLCLKKPRYKNEASFRTWLYTIARHLAVDYCRKNKKTVPQAEPRREMDAAQWDTVANVCIREEDRQTVRRAMEALRPEYTQILLLTYFEEVSNREAAKILKKSVHAVENLNYRARNALRAQLEKEGFVYENL